MCCAIGKYSTAVATVSSVLRDDPRKTPSGRRRRRYRWGCVGTTKGVDLSSHALDITTDHV